MYIHQDSMKRKRWRLMEAHKHEELEQRNTNMEGEEEKQQMTNAQLSLSRTGLHDASSHMTKERKLMENYKELLSTKKRPLDLNYKTKKVVFDGRGRPRRHKRKRAIVDVFYDDSKAKCCVMNRAKEIQANLDAKFPTFLKIMIRSNVTVGYLLNFPRSFSDMNMPRQDAVVVLVDTSGEEYQTKYLVEKNSLSAGWRAFSTAHKLNVGDVLLFQLIKHCKFKVYIVRTSEFDEVDGAIALLNLKADHTTTSNNSGNDAATHQEDREKHSKPLLPPDNDQDNIQKKSHLMLDINIFVTDDQSENDYFFKAVL